MYDNRTEEINEANKEHDDEVVAISKQHAVSDVFNEAAKQNLIRDIYDAEAAGVEIDQILADAKLPFDIDTLKPHPKPELEEGTLEDAKDTLDRIVCRNGDCFEAIK